MSRQRLPRLHRIFATFALGSLVLTGLAGCGGSQTGSTTGSGSQQTTSPATTQRSDVYTPAYKPNGKETAVIKTSKGTIVVQLFGNEAPIHVGNFVELARKGFYNDTKFHRYVPGFVVQGGDPATKDATSKQVADAAASGGGSFGRGGPGYQIQGEFDPATNPHKHERGALGMARSQSPDSAGSQFYFALEPLAQLDGSYTVFGQITQGLDVMDKLRAGDVIESVTIENAAE